jgi:hypothetical protein
VPEHGFNLVLNGVSIVCGVLCSALMFAKSELETLIGQASSSLSLIECFSSVVRL